MKPSTGDTVAKPGDTVASKSPSQPTGTCPVCYGTGRTSAAALPYAANCAGYDYASDTIPCTNCGGQRMFGTPSGRVPLRADGTPCRHDYIADKSKSRNCYNVYTCRHCGDSYDIDSGD